MAETAIKIENAGKKFCKGLNQSMIYGGLDILHSMIGGVPESSVLRRDEFWAVEDVSLELKQGETLGIVGPNGSGKTTLLKMLNGIFMPDKGRIEINGTVGALIQVGAGFHPVLSGRENIFINGAILGMSQKEIRAKYNAIVEFADIGDFLDAPVKHYSSGMYIRLGFAIAVHAEPDILLVDEILAVGDKDFQIKCYQKMHEIRERGTTIVMVSHDEYTIRENTERAIYLSNGHVLHSGSSEETISRYIKDVFEKKARTQRVESTAETGDKDKKASIVDLKFFDEEGRQSSSVESGRPVEIQVKCRVDDTVREPIIGVNFYDEDGLVYGANSKYENAGIKEFETGEALIKIAIPEFHLPTNNYLCSVSLAEESDIKIVDLHTKMYKLVVERARNARGSLKLKTSWKVETGKAL